MVTFTLDTNCLIDVAHDRPSAVHVRTLADAHASSKADVAIVAMSASERQPDHKYLSNYREFADWVASLGLSHLRTLLPLAFADVTFFDACVMGGPELIKRDREIGLAMFPAIEVDWVRFANARGIDIEDVSSQPGRRWRNALCDRQMFWAHDHNQRDIFVTSNVKDFLRLNKHPAFPSARVVTPDEAVRIMQAT
ncbi:MULTISPECIES: hypothetical protein [unclassified Rhizobium]|uniref:hypothetical protein n=1 Tax=unclassified Rhizobium TaxID=2613769 RepID=UPI0025FA1965|nr:hypothetical protein [Rhizobium sp. UBA1881]